MKIDVNNKTQRVYPKLMQDISSGKIVLFISTKIGVVILPDLSDDSGILSYMWDMNKFRDFTGSITLSND